MRRRAGCLALVLLAASSAAAQERELRSINDTVAGMTDDLHVTGYVATRCGGLFDGVMQYGGATLPPEVQSGYQDAIGVFTLGSTIMRIKQAENRGAEVDFESMMTRAHEDVLRFAGIYKDRLQSNFDYTGSMMEQDPMVQDDLDICGQALETIQQINAKVLGSNE